MMKFILAWSALNVAFASVIHPDANIHARANGLQPTVSGTVININPAGGSSTYPRLTHLADGSVLAGFTAFSGATHILTVTRSTDGAETFSAWGSVASGTGDLDNINLIQLANGNIVAAFRNHDVVNGVHTFFRVRIFGAHSRM